MSEANKQLIRRWIAFANTAFAGNFDDFIAPDYVGHLGGSETDRPELERLDRHVEFTSMVIYRIGAGKIVESWGEVDFLRLMRQLRAPKPNETATA